MPTHPHTRTHTRARTHTGTEEQKHDMKTMGAEEVVENWDDQFDFDVRFNGRQQGPDSSVNNVESSSAASFGMAQGPELN